MDFYKDSAKFSDQRKIWAHFQNAAHEVFEGAKPRLDYIVRRVSKIAGQRRVRILNVGLGSGYLEERCQERQWEVYSLDPDQTAIAGLVGRGLSGCAGLIEQLPFESAIFDFVIVSEVIEHLNNEQRDRGIKEMARVLKQSGWLLGTVPYAEDLVNNFTVCPKCGETFHRWGHQKSFDIRSIRAELSGEFFVVTCRRTGFVNLRQRTLAGKVRSLVRLMLAKLGEQVASPSIYFAARKLNELNRSEGWCYGFGACFKFFPSSTAISRCADEQENDTCM